MQAITKAWSATLTKLEAVPWMSLCGLTHDFMCRATDYAERYPDTMPLRLIEIDTGFLQASQQGLG